MPAPAAFEWRAAPNTAVLALVAADNAHPVGAADELAASLRDFPEVSAA
jgi:hypothetical protein